MNIIIKGKKTFLQSYNPMNIEIVEKQNNQIVHRFCSSPEMMSASDRVAYYAGLSYSWRRVRGA